MLWRKTVTYTRFEKARIIGARALQLSMGAPSILAEIPKDTIDPVEIAMLEYDEGAIPITVKRKERKA
jgi:DNA-directed RNA polymerase subunit K